MTLLSLLDAGNLQQMSLWNFLGYWFLGKHLVLFNINFPNFLVNSIWETQNVAGEKSSPVHRKEIRGPATYIVMVNFMCQINWDTKCPDIWSNIFRVFLWGCFWWDLVFKSVEWVKKIALHNVSGPQLIN